MPSSEDSSVDLENVSSGDSLDYGDAAASKETGSGEVKSKAPAPLTHLCGIPMKFVQVFILLLLMAQNVAMYTVARYSQAGGKSTKPYLKTTVVLMQELVKITACFVIISVQSGFGGMINLVRTEIFGKFGETLKVGVPALLYFCQNTLFYVGSANMNAAPFQAALQFKVVTTAIVTVIFFRRCIKPLQWVAICGLMGGIVLVVLSNLKDTAPKPNTNPVIGYGATLGICALAACASVYFEHILKGSSVSIWVRNIQLAMMSIVVAVITVFAKDGAKIAQDGFFQGYTKWTCLAISIVAGGGLVIAMVLKYASSILKTFATGSAIVVTGVISAFTPAMDFTPNMMFIGGALIVVGSIFAYGIAGQKKGPTAIVHASDSK